MVFGVASRTAKDLLIKYGGAAAVKDAVISGKARVGQRIYEKAVSVSGKECERIVKDCAKHKVKLIPFGSSDYPRYLSELNDAPIIIYALGDVSFLNDNPCICIAGPRESTKHGLKATFSLSARLSACGFSVVTGLADGVDTAAHLGSISVGGKTVMVLPCGILRPYRKDKDSLKSRVLNAGGCIISEFPPYFDGGKGNFKIRNRIMSGLCVGTVIPEASERSGALITANHAAEQGRDVFVVPSILNDQYHKGSNKLLDDGAIRLESAMDIVNEYISLFPDKIKPDGVFSKSANEVILKCYRHAENEILGKEEKPSLINKIIKEKPQKITRPLNTDRVLSNDAKKVLAAINTELFSTDCLEIDEDSLEKGMFLALFELERAGYIESAPSGFYRRINND